MDCFERTWRKKKNMDWSRKSALFIYEETHDSTPVVEILEKKSQKKIIPFNTQLEVWISQGCFLPHQN